MLEPITGREYNTNHNKLTHFSPVQECLQKSYSIPLRNSGVSDVKVRSDQKIIASGGWDGR